MTDQRTGLVHNYNRLPGLLGEGLVNWRGTAEQLWNAAEASENRVNSRIGRELRPALPAELPLDEQRRLVHGFCCWLHDHHQIAAHWVIHAPNFHDPAEGKRLWKARASDAGKIAYEEALCNPDHTNLNFHAHIRWTARRVDKDTGAFGDKTREFDRTNPRELSAEERREGREPVEKIVGREVIKNIRDEWERRTNAALKRVGSTARIDLRSYEAMAAAGVAPEGMEPQEHMGPCKSARTRDAERLIDPAMPMVAVRNAEKKRRNESRWSCWLELRQLGRERARLEGGSERIARENEDRRLQRVEVDREAIRNAETKEAQRLAVLEAQSVDIPDADRNFEAAMAWAKGKKGKPDAPTSDFDSVLDLEAAGKPAAPSRPKKDQRVRMRVADRQRMRN